MPQKPSTPSTVGDRLQEVMDDRGYNQTSLSESSGVSRGTIRRHLDRDERPTHKSSKRSLRELADFLNVRYDWLASGEGVRELRQKEPSLEVEGATQTVPVGYDEEVFQLTIYHSIEAGASENGHINYAADLQEADTEEYPRELFHDLLGFWPPTEMKAVYARGVSMEPGVRDERLVLYKPVKDVVSGTRYVVLIYDPMTGDWYTRVKRLHRLTGGGLRIISDNPRVEDETLILNENDKLVNEETGRPVNIRIIGRVLWPTAETDEDRVQTITQTLQQLASSGQLDLS